MVGDWQHAESPLMRPRMSDGLRVQEWMLETCWGVRCVEMVLALNAEREARSILADVEPRQEQGMSGHWPCGRPSMAWQADRFCYDESGYLSGTGWLAHAALVESLRSFVEGN